MIRCYRNALDSRKNKDYISEDDIKLLQYVKRKSKTDYTVLLIHFRYEQYVWHFYPLLKTNPTLATISRELELANTNNSIPENIINIVYLINKATCFNARIRFYYYILSWEQKIFLYYNRYYRYLRNEREFNKKKALEKRNSYKVHFIPYIYHRQLTGIRIDKNNLYYKL